MIYWISSLRMTWRCVFLPVLITTGVEQRKIMSLIIHVRCTYVDILIVDLRKVVSGCWLLNDFMAVSCMLAIK